MPLIDSGMNVARFNFSHGEGSKHVLIGYEMLFLATRVQRGYSIGY